MKKRTSQLGRLVAAITLPFVMTACVTWRQRDLTDLRDVIVNDQPEEIRLRTETSDAELTIAHPQLFRDTISGSPDGSVMKIPFADVTNLRVYGGPSSGDVVLGVVGRCSVHGDLADTATIGAHPHAAITGGPESTDRVRQQFRRTHVNFGVRQR